MDDSSLVARARTGSREAFDALVERHYSACTRLAWRLLGRRQDAEDAVQEAFLRAWKAIGRYEEQRCFKAWLFRILVNRCRTSGARRSRIHAREGSDLASAEEFASTDDGPVHELRDALQVALARLNPSNRELVLLKYGEGLDYETLSEVLDTSVSALKMRLLRAREQLRDALEEDFGGG
jgi:RNA polymerase sigma-70 factor (ECF subfamily)